MKNSIITDETVDTLRNLIRQLVKEELNERQNYSSDTNDEEGVVNDNLTIVSGLWNIGREGRSFEHYLQHFELFLKIPVNMFLYIPSELEQFVWKHRNKKNTVVKICELDDIKSNYYAPFWDRTQEIRTSDQWLEQTGEYGWLKDSPQAKNEWYNPIVQSKMFMLHDAKIINPFDTDYLIWLDAGITNTVYENYFIKNRCLDKITQYLDSFLFLSYPYQSAGEIHGFNYDAINTYAKDNVNYVCRGGLFGGHKDYISNANATYYSTLLQTLSDGYMGTEESIFTVMSYLEPHIYKRYELDDNGLIVKFVEDLVNDSVNLVVNRPKGYGIPKKLYNKNKDKTSLYVLGFNFPEQFKTLLESFEKHPEWLERPRKILINNSDDQSAIEEYEKLCKEYNFEHIITGENLGINRGRLYAAKHFDESDSDYYFFFEDDMCLHSPENVGVCRNGFRQYIPNLYEKVHEIIARENFDFLKLSYTEVYMDNNIQVSWYNVPSETRDEIWPDYNVLPIAGIDPHSPRTTFNNIGVYNELSYIDGEIYYANWPMIVSREGNKKMFLEVEWEYPYEQTWMSHMFQETIKGNLHPAVLLASPINHNRIKYYKPEQRKEN